MADVKAFMGAIAIMIVAILFYPFISGFTEASTTGEACGIFDVHVPGCGPVIFPLILIIISIVVIFMSVVQPPQERRRRRREIDE